MSSAVPESRRCLSLRTFARAADGTFVIYVIVILLLVTFENRIVFHPVPASQRWIEPAAGTVFHDVGLQAADGTTIHARWFPSDGARGAVLICHSRAGNLSLELSQAELDAWQRILGMSVLIFDYAGYGRSDGKPSEAGCYGAAQAAYTWLTQTKEIPPADILIYGRSLGSAVAVDLASQVPHRALILVSPFTSLPDAAFSQCPLLPTHLLMHNRFASLAKIGQCTRPIMVIHGTADNQVPIAQGQRLFAAANEPKCWVAVAGAGHGNCVIPAVFVRMRDFLITAKLFPAADSH